MGTALDKFKPFEHLFTSCDDSLDGKVVTIHDHEVYTLPNVTFVPKTHMWQIEELQARLSSGHNHTV
ncbi:hypothetical protein PAXRUDRAFT_16702 [Paxillus rubicundulus Ve08.2h10]|uniref:Unplaced genomic scaffold scaffold_1662, whole genome shotgun sequence n=1 Tax=Paxillus rubicundulus Ve08.2h10 TaxID=930991 RepID=A0A0D0CTL8_9AGAM|nr:hypothetical protein PAXRUDRAFT_16702 [Paxillus rubicundulus Ve08.2h10]